jgi:hypothetical protein
MDEMGSPAQNEQPGSTPQFDDSIQAVEPEVTVAPAVAETASEVAETVPAQPVYSDEELRALGWTDQQIEWQRQSEQMQ